MSPQGNTVPNQVPVPFIGDGLLPPMPPMPPAPREPAAHSQSEPSTADLAVMSPQQVKRYLTTLIAREWAKSATPLYPSSWHHHRHHDGNNNNNNNNNKTAVADLMLSDKEMAVCHVKFRCEDVPRDVVAKVRYLAELGETEEKEGGMGCFSKLMALLKREVRLVTFEDDVNSPKIDKYEGVEGAVAMLAELAIYLVQTDIDYALNTNRPNKILFKVATVCGRGHTYTYTFSTLADAPFAAVTRDLARRFPRLCDPRCAAMVGRWRAHARDLRRTGMGGHPKLALVERLIDEHLGAPHGLFDDDDEWMYVHELGSRGDRLRGEGEFRTLMRWAAGCVDRQPKGCLMRVMEAKVREIFAALRTIDEDQRRMERRNAPVRLVATTPAPKPEPRSSSSKKSTVKKPRAKAKAKGKGNAEKQEEIEEESGGSGKMPWNLEDLESLGFEKEGDVIAPKKREGNMEHVVFGRGEGAAGDDGSPRRATPRKQGIHRS